MLEGAVSVQDYRLNAEVRRFLVSRWVDVGRLQIGTTNGVVYIMGVLDTTMEDPHRRVDEVVHRAAGERVLRLTMSLDKSLRRIPDVRDVVFKLENVHRRGGRWRVTLGGDVHGASADSRLTGGDR